MLKLVISINVNIFSLQHDFSGNSNDYRKLIRNKLNSILLGTLLLKTGG